MEVSQRGVRLERASTRSQNKKVDPRRRRYHICTAGGRRRFSPLWYGLRFLGCGGACFPEVAKRFFLCFSMLSKSPGDKQPDSQSAQPAQPA